MAALPGTAIAQEGEEYQTNERGLDRRNMDTSVNACQDFYQFANGNWFERNPIPADQSAWGIGNEMRERNYLLLREILEAAAAAGAEAGTNKQRVGDFWLTGMDTDGIEADGLGPLAADLQRIEEMQTRAGLPPRRHGGAVWRGGLPGSHEQRAVHHVRRPGRTRPPRPRLLHA
jgi:putative endopeptidase